MNGKKQIRIWVDIEDVAEYEYEAEEVLGDKSKSNAMIKAEFVLGAKTRREKRLSKQQSPKELNVMDVFDGL